MSILFILSNVSLRVIVHSVQLSSFLSASAEVTKNVGLFRFLITVFISFVFGFSWIVAIGPIRLQDVLDGLLTS